MARKWVMSYQKSRTTTDGNLLSQVGQCATDQHPIAQIEEWNRFEREREQKAPKEFKCYPWVNVLLWYAELSEQEQADLAAAGVDLAAIDNEIDVAAQ